jgi:hypothetical protein
VPPYAGGAVVRIRDAEHLAQLGPAEMSLPEFVEREPFGYWSAIAAIWRGSASERRRGRSTPPAERRAARALDVRTPDERQRLGDLASSSPSTAVNWTQKMDRNDPGVGEPLNGGVSSRRDAAAARHSRSRAMSRAAGRSVRASLCR